MKITYADISKIKNGQFGKLVYMYEREGAEDVTYYDFVVAMADGLYRGEVGVHMDDWPSQMFSIRKVRPVQRIVTDWEYVAEPANEGEAP